MKLVLSVVVSAWLSLVVSSRSSMMLSASLTLRPRVCSASLVCFMDISMFWLSWLWRRVSRCCSIPTRFLPMFARVPRSMRLRPRISCICPRCFTGSISRTRRARAPSSVLVFSSAVEMSAMLASTLISARCILSRAPVPKTATAMLRYASATLTRRVSEHPLLMPGAWQIGILREHRFPEAC